MANNGKKEFPINGLEEDVASTYARSAYCYTKNVRGITRFAKNQMNRRFRRFNKNLPEHILIDLEGV